MTGICHDGRWYLQVQMQDIVLHSNTCCWGGQQWGRAATPPSRPARSGTSGWPLSNPEGWTRDGPSLTQPRRAPLISCDH